MNKKTVLLVLSLVCLMLSAPNCAASTTHVESIVADSLVHDNTVGNDELTFKVYVPDDYNQGRSQGYPVLYLLHGSHGKVTDWDRFLELLDELISKGVIEPVLAVVPVTGNSYWVDSDEFGAYESAVMFDLIPHIDRTYNTIPTREGRYLMGFSMGGYGALRYALAYPDQFGGATLLSPFVQDGEPPITSGAVERGSFGKPFSLERWSELNYPNLITSYVNQEYQVPIYIFAGDDDWNHLSEKDDLPADAWKYNMEVQAVKLYQALARRNIYDVSFEKWEPVPASPTELRIENGGHSTSLWLKGFEEGLKYMFGREESERYSPRYDEGRYVASEKGEVTVHHLTSQSLGEDLEYVVYLPHNYDPAVYRYPVLYLLHGSWGTNESWKKFWPILDTMIEEGTIEPVIAVAPVTGNSYWVDSEMFGNCETAVIKDLIPYIDESYSTISSRDGRALIGFSMGGYGALRYGLVYPDLFSGAVLLSPAIQEGEAPVTSGAVERGSFGNPFDPAVWEEKNYVKALEGYSRQSHTVPMFIFTGDDDWNHLSEQEDLPADAEKYNIEMQAVLLYQRLHRQNVFGEPYEKWEDVPSSPAELRIVNGGHDSHVWSAGFEQGIEYLFSNGLSKARIK